MRQRLAVAVALLLLSPTHAMARDREAKARKARLAVLEFPAAPGAWGCPGWGNSERRMANVLRDLFTSEIDESADGKVRLVERERLNDIRGELKLQQSGEVDPATAQQVGKLLGVRYMLTGKMTRFACKKTGASTGWGVGTLVKRATGSSFAGDVAGSAKTQNVSFEGRLDVRLIDTKTGEILGTFKDEEETNDRSVKIAGGGYDVAYDDGLASAVFEPIAKRQASKIVKKLLKAHEENLEDEEEEAAAAPAQQAGPTRVASAGGSGEGGGGYGGGSAGAASSGGPVGGSAGGGGGGLGGGDGNGEGSAASAAQVFSNDYDFVPGEKVLFFDDFSDTAVGDSPIRFAGAGLAVVEADGKRWAKETKYGNCSGSGQRVRLDIKGDMPKKFTVEFDAVMGLAGVYKVGLGDTISVWWNGVRLRGEDINQDLPKGIQHVAISVNETYVKVYVGGRRVHQHTEGARRPIREVKVCFYESGQIKLPEKRALITNFKIAEGGKDYATELTSLGRIVTHGITFDSGSDRIRPESGPTLRQILKLMQDDASLSLEIEGHTDNQGGDKVNGPLSERRAAAVKAWLASQGIEDGRLGTKGMGASKPLESNDTPEGRANNRRVEFAKRGG